MGLVHLVGSVGLVGLMSLLSFVGLVSLWCQDWLILGIFLLFSLIQKILTKGDVVFDPKEFDDPLVSDSLEFQRNVRTLMIQRISIIPRYLMIPRKYGL